jgi:uncharacterized membrane protein
MNEYFIIKWIHILSATLLFGTGLGSAFYKWLTDRSGNLSAMSETNRLVVLADWLFTTPTIIIQPITGIWLLSLMGIPLDQGWVILSIILYIIAGICWLPVVWLQIRMRNMTANINEDIPYIDKGYRYYANLWFSLGIPAFIAMIVVYFLMVFKPSFTI